MPKLRNHGVLKSKEIVQIVFCSSMWHARETVWVRDYCTSYHTQQQRMSPLNVTAGSAYSDMPDVTWGGAKLSGYLMVRGVSVSVSITT